MSLFLLSDRKFTHRMLKKIFLSSSSKPTITKPKPQPPTKPATTKAPTTKPPKTQPPTKPATTKAPTRPRPGQKNGISLINSGSKIELTLSEYRNNCGFKLKKISGDRYMLSATLKEGSEFFCTIPLSTVSVLRKMEILLWMLIVSKKNPKVY